MRWRCTECGFYAAGPTRPRNHTCTENNIVDYQMRQFDKQYKSFLSSNEGQFALVYADRLIQSQGILQDDSSQGDSQPTKE